MYEVVKKILGLMRERSLLITIESVQVANHRCMSFSYRIELLATLTGIRVWIHLRIGPTLVESLAAVHSVLVVGRAVRRFMSTLVLLVCVSYNAVNGLSAISDGPISNPLRRCRSLLR